MESIESQMKAIELTNKKITEKRTTLAADGDEERLKKIRKLKKSLRQIEELENMIKDDKNCKLEKEQIEKLSRKDALVEALKELGEDI